MFENFNFSWFLTTPGILTILGCLLILISIIILISSLGGKKSKDTDENGNVNNVDSETNAINNGVAPVSVVPEVNPVEVAPVSVTPEVKPVEVAPVSVTPEVKPVEIAPAPVTPEIKPVEITPASVTPEIKPVEVAPAPVTPEVKPVEIAPAPVTPEIKPVEVAPAPVTPEVNPQASFSGINIEPTIVKPVNPNMEANPVNLPYGGASPSVEPTIISKPTEKVIYGGADPLAGTASIPVQQPKKEDIESL